MTQIKLLLGDEAIAEGALQAGIKGVYAYPGTPSTEITEYIQHAAAARDNGIHCTWSSNEKTAMEAALGMSYAGCRSMVCMKWPPTTHRCIRRKTNRTHVSTASSP